MRSFRHQLPGLDVGIPFFLPGWMVMLSAPCYFGGSKMPAQTQKAAPPPAPPAPPKASDATAATRTLIRDIASQRSRQTTVLTRRRDKLTPGSMDWPVNPSNTVLTQPLTPVGPAPSTLPPPPLAPPGPGMPAPVTGTGTAGTNIGGATILGPQVGGPGGQLGSLITAVNDQNTPSPTYGYGTVYDNGNTNGTPVQVVAGVDEHVPFNQVTDYLM